MDIQQRVAKIETATNKVDHVADKADEAYVLAKEAKSKAEQNGKDIEEIKEQSQWAFRASIGAVVSVVVAVIGAFASNLLGG